MSCFQAISWCPYLQNDLCLQGVSYLRPFYWLEGLGMNPASSGFWVGLVALLLTANQWICSGGSAPHGSRLPWTSGQARACSSHQNGRDRASENMWCFLSPRLGIGTSACMLLAKASHMGKLKAKGYMWWNHDKSMNAGKSKELRTMLQNDFPSSIKIGISSVLS